MREGGSEGETDGRKWREGESEENEKPAEHLIIYILRWKVDHTYVYKRVEWTREEVN